MRSRTLAWVIALTACGSSPPPAPASAADPPAPEIAAAVVVPIEAAPTPSVVPPSRLDALVQWIIERDVDSLTVHRGDVRDVGITLGGASHVCRGDQCFTLPFAESIVHFGGAFLGVVPRADPTRHASWSFAIRGETATLVQTSTRPRVSPLGARPPLAQTAARGRERITALDPSAPSPIAGLDEASSQLGDAWGLRAETLRAGDRRITVVIAELGQEDSEWLVLVRSPGVVARSDVRRSASPALEEMAEGGLMGDFTLVRTSTQAGRGWGSDLWSVSVREGRVEIASVSLGGADGYGEGCERESDGYGVWLTGCERALVFDGADRAHLGSPMAWVAQHRRLSDRWTYEPPADPPEGCPPESSLCLTSRGLVPCAEE